MAARPSDTARSLRLAARGMVLLALIATGLMIGGLKGWVRHDTEPYSRMLLLGAIVGAVYLGFKGHARALAERDRSSGHFMLMTIAAQLNKQDDATLATIAAKGGPASEAARMVLAARREPGRMVPPRGC
jgi:hypothetical protein